MKNKMKVFTSVLLIATTVFSTSVISFGNTISESREIHMEDAGLYFGEDPAIPNENIPIYGQEDIRLKRVVYATTTSSVNFRSKPSTVEGEIYYQISKGVLLEIVDSTTEVSWCKVKHTAGGTTKTGYVHKDYLKF